MQARVIRREEPVCDSTVACSEQCFSREIPSQQAWKIHGQGAGFRTALGRSRLRSASLPVISKSCQDESVCTHSLGRNSLTCARFFILTGSVDPGTI